MGRPPGETVAGTATARPATPPPLLARLQEAAAAELAAYHRSTVLRAAADEELSPILDDIAAEERRHYEALIRRVRQLGGKIPSDLTEFCAFLKPEPEREIVVEIEDSVNRYSSLCALAETVDKPTLRICQAILWEKKEHRSWLLEHFGQGTESRFRPGFRGRSPYLAAVTRTGPDPSSGPAG